MRTRRSFRNQNILWRALGGPAAPARPAPTIAERIASEQRVIDCPFTSRQSKVIARRVLASLQAKAGAP